MAFGDLKGTLVVNAKSITNPFVATGSVSVSVGDLIFCTYCEQGGTTTATACTDGLNGAGVAYTAANTGSAGRRSFWLISPNAGTLSAVNLACTASTNNATMVVGVFTGPFAANPLDVNTAMNTDSSHASPWDSAASGTLAQASELIVTPFGLVPSSGQPFTATSPALLAAEQRDAGNATGAVLAYQVVASTSSLTQQIASGSSVAMVAVSNVMSFMAPAADTLFAQACL